MMSNDDKYYKSMYHTMFHAAETAVNWLMDGKDPIWAVHILLQAMGESEAIYVNESIPTQEERKMTRTLIEQFLAEKSE